MPLYEYECKKCGQVFETIQKFSDEPLKKHPKCGGKVTRLISAAGLHFKGTGWYITDYARAGGASAAEKSDKAAEKGESTPKTETVKADAPKTESAKPAASDSGSASTKAGKSAAKATKKK